jgi:outer membrane protein W
MTTALTKGFAADSTAQINHNDKLGINLGVGLDRKLTKRLTFRIDVRDHVTSSPAFGLPNTYSYANYPVSGRANNIVYTAGILFHLGKL